MPDIGTMIMREIAQRMGSDDEESARPKLLPPLEAQDLRDGLAALNTEHHFEPGMIVRQKKSCRRYRDFTPNGYSIVVEVFDYPRTPNTHDQNCGSFMHQISIVIGNRADDGDFCLHYVDGRRFEPVPAAELELHGCVG